MLSFLYPEVQSVVNNIDNDVDNIPNLIEGRLALDEEIYELVKNYILYILGCKRDTFKQLIAVADDEKDLNHPFLLIHNKAKMMEERKIQFFTKIKDVIKIDKFRDYFHIFASEIASFESEYGPPDFCCDITKVTGPMVKKINLISKKQGRVKVVYITETYADILFDAFFLYNIEHRINEIMEDSPKNSFFALVTFPKERKFTVLEEKIISTIIRMQTFFSVEF